MMHKNNFSIKDVILFGFRKTIGSYLSILQIMVFAGLIIYVSRSVTSYISALIMLCLGISLTTVFLMISRGQKTVFSDLFKKYKGYEIFLNYFLASVLFAVILGAGLAVLFLALLVLGVLGLAPTLSGFGMINTIALLVLIPCVLPGLYLLTRLQFYKFFVIDKNMGPIPALKESWRITRGNFWKLVQYLLVVVLINVLVVMIVRLGGNVFLALLILTVPVVAIASAHLYGTLSGEKLVKSD